MYAAKEETLTPDELRKRLYLTFKNKGVLDTLKTQLRNQLIQELKHPPLAVGEPVPRLVSVKSEPLMVSVCNSIVADHLRTSGYEYTLSIFYPESGLNQDKVFSRADLLHLLKVDPDSALYNVLSVNRNSSDNGFLMSLLSHLTHHNTRSLCQDADTQTTSTAAHGESLVEKMKLIDKEYESFSYSGDKRFSFQSQLATYRKEMEAQLETEMNTMLQHFKEVEVTKVRLDEKSKFQKEFDKMKQDLERSYELKAKALMDREKNAIERLQKQQEIEEKKLYSERQLVLKEIESVRTRENELRMKEEAFEKTGQLHGEKVRTTEELLRRRELSVKTMEDTHEQRLNNELSRYRLELKEEYVKRTETLTENETRNKVEMARIQRETAVIDSKLEEHSKALSQLRRTQVELDTAQQQISMMGQQKELLQERLENMSDYSTLKREKTDLQAQMRMLKKQLDDAQEENQLLRADLGKPSSEHLAAQMELRSLQSACRLKEEEFDNQKQVLQAQLQLEVQRCAQLKAQIMECEEKSQWMANHAEDVKMQLQQTQQALENEVLRNPKPSLVDRSVLELSADKLVPPDIYVDKALLSSRVGSDDVCKADGAPQQRKDPWCDSPYSDSDLVAEAMTRFQELQKEAEILEEAYRNYQQRAMHSTLSHMPPPRSISPRSSQHHSSSSRKQVSHHSQSRLPHNSKVSHKPLSPQMTQATHSPSYNTRNTLPPVQPRVTFSEAPAVFTQPGLQSRTEHPPLRDRPAQDESSSPAKHLSSSSYSASSKQPQKENREDTVVTPVAIPELSSDRLLSHDSHREIMTSGDFSLGFSPPLSPQLKSTTRHQSSPPKLQQVFSSSESSPQPEKISLEDLTSITSEPGHIPQLLLDTAVPLTEEAPDGPAVPRPQDLPEDPADVQDWEDVPHNPGESVTEDDEYTGEQSWERERRERLEQRQREQEEAKERELQELERLEKEELLQEKTTQEKEEEEMVTNEGDEDKVESQAENPLEKYMKMVLEAREMQHGQSPEREKVGHTSSEDKSLSEGKEDSIDAYSQKDEDDDFWSSGSPRL